MDYKKILDNHANIEWSACAQLYPRKISMHCMHKYDSNTSQYILNVNIS